MEINLLEKLLNFGLANGYFSITEIGKLDKSCCQNLKTEVIDFDKTEEFHRKAHNYQNLKSCDALKILDQLKRIDFIEMKGFKEFIKRQLNHSNSIDSQVRVKITDFDFLSKIRDSIIILNNIVLSKSFDITGKEQKIYHKIVKNFIILTDIDIQQNPLELIAFSLSFLGQTSSDMETIVAKLVDDEIKQLAAFENIQKPILLTCKKFDEFYKNN